MRALSVALCIALVIVGIMFEGPDPRDREGYKRVTILYGATGVEGYVTEDAYYALVNRRPKNPIVVYDPYNAELYTEIERSSIRAVLE